MMQLQMTLLFLIVASTSPAVVSQRPTMKEYKEQKAKEAGEAANKTADEAKGSAVDKVIEMLSKLTLKVRTEGDEEAKTYTTFACFCKDMLKEKKEAIDAGTDDKATLSGEIDDLATKREEDDATIKTLEGEIADAKKKIKEAEEENVEKIKAFNENKAKLEKAVRALGNALEALKASKPASLVQLQKLAPTLRWAESMADALGELKNKGSVTALLQAAPEVEMENYKFHSSSVITTLEKLQDDFRTKLNTAESEEVARVQAFDMTITDLKNDISVATTSMENTQAAKEDKIALIGDKSKELTAVSAKLLDDQKYNLELHTMCSDKAAAWKQRSQARADELNALVSATEIIKTTVKESTTRRMIRFAQRGATVRLAINHAHSEDVMEALEADAESVEDAPAAPTFLQKARREQSAEPHATLPPQVLDFLKSKGTQLKSQALATLASEITTASLSRATDPFAKVKQLITDLIAKLQAQAAEEATWKTACDENYATEKGNRDSAVTAIKELNSQMAELEAEIADLTEKQATLEKEIAELVKEKEEADKLRNAERSENEKGIEEATTGLAAVKSAIKILTDYYDAAADNTVLLQQTPVKDAPDAGFGGSEAYKGSQDSKIDVLGLLAVIESDFTRTIDETTKAEAAAKKEHEDFTKKNKESQDEKKAVLETTKTELGTAKTDHQEKMGTLSDEKDNLKNALKAIISLDWTCRRKETGETYEERVAKREEEIAAAKKALCILINFKSYGGSTATAFDVCEQE